jgi:hypothetical protein
MSEKTKLALLVVAVVALVGLAGYLGYDSLRDKSVPTVSPSYQKLSPEERERLRQEGLARRRGIMQGGAPPTGTAPQ